MRNGLLTLHIVSAILLLGWLLMQTMLLPRAIRQGPENLAVVRYATRGDRVVGRLTPLVFLLGVALAARIGGEIWSQPWLNLSMTLFIVMSVIGAVLIPRVLSGAVAELEQGQPALDAAKRLAMLGGINTLIVIVIVYLMVAKPGA